jgi:hypothetical protein
MAIADRIHEGLQWWRAGRYEASLLPICAAVDATAQAEMGIARGTGRTYKDWLKQNMWAVCAGGLKRIMAPKIRVPSKHPDIPADSDGMCDFLDVVYHVVRCGLMHHADIGKFVSFSPNVIIGCDGPAYTLADTFPLGLALPVVLSPTNSQQRLLEDVEIPIWKWAYRVNSLWGQRAMMLKELELDALHSIAERDRRRAAGGTV